MTLLPLFEIKKALPSTVSTAKLPLIPLPWSVAITFGVSGSTMRPPEEYNNPFANFNPRRSPKIRRW